MDETRDAVERLHSIFGKLRRKHRGGPSEDEINGAIEEACAEIKSLRSRLAEVDRMHQFLKGEFSAATRQRDEALEALQKRVNECRCLLNEFLFPNRCPLCQESIAIINRIQNE